jgi:hypothetical protein
MVGEDIGGALELLVGGPFALAFGKIGLSEIQDFADMTAQTVVRQN